MDSGLRIIADEARHIFKVPRRAFIEPEVLERERRAIFDTCWLYLGHESEVPNPGDFITRKVGGRPILLTHDADGNYNALLNVCTHRGAMVCRESKGSSKAFQCLYHGWVFENTGRLMIVPGDSGFPKGYKNDPSTRLAHVPRFDSFAGFFFISFAADGEDLATYLAGAGDELKLISEQSPKGMTIIGGTQEYSIAGNWKLLVENSADGYHAASTHSTYLEYLKNTNSTLSSTKLSGYATDLGNGHAVIEYSAPWGRPVANWVPLMGEEGKAEIEAIERELVARVGAERADRIAKKSRNLIVFPNLVINDVMSLTVRTFWPERVDYMEVSGWALGPVDESDWLREFRLFNFTEFLGPGGFATPDDVEVILKCQAGYQAASEVPYNDISRGMAREGRQLYDDELQFRCFWSEWDRRLAEVGA